MFELLAASLQFLMHEKGRGNLIWDFIPLSGLRQFASPTLQKTMLACSTVTEMCCQSRVHPKWLRGMTYSVYKPNSWPCDIWQRQWETERQMKCEQRWTEAAAPPACLQKIKQNLYFGILLNRPARMSCTVVSSRPAANMLMINYSNALQTNVNTFLRLPILKTHIKVWWTFTWSLSPLPWNQKSVLHGISATRPKFGCVQSMFLFMLRHSKEDNTFYSTYRGYNCQIKTITTFGVEIITTANCVRVRLLGSGSSAVCS